VLEVLAEIAHGRVLLNVDLKVHNCKSEEARKGYTSVRLGITLPRPGIRQEKVGAPNGKNERGRHSGAKMPGQGET
jgi:hypothetical protein